MEFPGDVALDVENHTTYRTVVGALFLFVVDRSDLAYSVRLVSQKLGGPMEPDWIRLKLLVKFAQGIREERQELRRTKESGSLETHVDSDWVGDKRTLKSCGCAVIRLDGVVLSSRQKIEALSLAEAEFYAVMGTSEALHMQQPQHGYETQTLGSLQ